MIAKKYRLQKKYIPYVLSKGEKSVSKLFIIRHRENTEEFSKYCAIISKKISNKAVIRNKLRRQIFEIIRLSKGINELKKNIVLIPKKSILSSSYSEISEDINSFPKILTPHNGETNKNP